MAVRVYFLRAPTVLDVHQRTGSLAVSVSAMPLSAVDAGFVEAARMPGQNGPRAPSLIMRQTLEAGVGLPHSTQLPDRAAHVAVEATIVVDAAPDIILAF